MLSYFKKYFLPCELILWCASSGLIVLCFIIFDRTNYPTLLASLLGVTSLIFSAKASPLGQLLMILFSIAYGIISYSFCYYGEMITYLGMTMPMSVFSLIAWLKNPSSAGRAEVRVNTITKREMVSMCFATAAVTMVFYFILRHFNTANLVPSTVSVATSFAAVYLTFRRSPSFALAYAANDIVLIILWFLASLHNTEYISVLACFAAFLANDLYGFSNWCKMKKKQAADEVFSL